MSVVVSKDAKMSVGASFANLTCNAQVSYTLFEIAVQLEPGCSFAIASSSSATSPVGLREIRDRARLLGSQPSTPYSELIKHSIPASTAVFVIRSWLLAPAGLAAEMQNFLAS